MDHGGAMLTAEQARRWLHEVLPERDLVGMHFDRLASIDKGLGLRPPLLWAAILAQRDGVMDDPELWGSLNDRLRAWMIVLSDDERDQLVSLIIDNAIAHYQIPDDDDDPGEWWLWDRDNRRVLTRSEAERALIDYVLKGERQDLLDRLAEMNDDIKVMLAAVPLESEASTLELVSAVVKDVVAKEYYDKGGGPT
jgi:hypothetical protein